MNKSFPEYVAEATTDKLTELWRRWQAIGLAGAPPWVTPASELIKQELEKRGVIV